MSEIGRGTVFGDFTVLGSEGDFLWILACSNGHLMRFTTKQIKERKEIKCCYCNHGDKKNEKQ
jgi:hypothetical protein